MSGETERDPSGWNVDTLHSHLTVRLNDLMSMLNERFESQRRAVEVAIHAETVALRAAADAQKEAINKADAASEKRFEAVNEFRRTLSDQAQTFMSRTESLSRHDRTAELIDSLETRLLTQGEVRDKRISVLEQFQASWSNVEARLHQLNQLRSEVLEDRAVFLRREVFDTMAGQMHDRLSELRNDMISERNEYVRSSEYNANTQRTILAAEAKDARITALELRVSSRLDQRDGRAQGMDKAWVVMIGAVGLISTIVAIVLAMSKF